MFHTVPPRAQRLLHSEAYIRLALTIPSLLVSPEWSKGNPYFLCRIPSTLLLFLREQVHHIAYSIHRYIEGLTVDSQSMCSWDKQLNASKETTKTDEAKLPAHWLADNGEHGTSLDALWALRDFMTTDALGLTKIL